jgi:SAM-dependent methyltransferase
MFFGRDCYRNPETLLEMLGESRVQSKASSKWLRPLIKAYIYVFGLPDVSTQLRAQYFRRFIKPFKFTKVLDAGCGIGLYAIYLAKKHPLAKIDACDYDSRLVEAGRAMLSQLNLNNVNIFQADLSQFSESDEYEVILCQDVLDQIEDDGRLIRGFHRALKDDGILYLTIPHERHTKRYFTRFEWVSDKRHVRKGYSEQGLTGLLQNNGFKVKSIKNVWGTFGEGCMELYMLTLLHLPLPFAALLFPLLSTVSLLDMITGNSKGYGIIAIAQKKSLAAQ